MNAEFNVWLLIVGLILGAGLVWLVIMDSRRRESEVDEVERPREAAWLSAVLTEDGYDVSPDLAERVLLLHRAYLDAPPPDGAMDDEPAPDAVVVDASPPDGAVGEESVAASQSPLMRTGSESTLGADTATSETPKVSELEASATAGEAPRQ